MKRKLILIFMMVLAIGMTACSSGAKKNAISAETDSRQETAKGETTSAITPETSEAESPNSEMMETEESISLENEKNVLCDPMVGIVENYEDNMITIKNPDDDMLYYFFTDNAQILEGFSTENAQPISELSPIAVGEKVEISYRGTLDDKDHPTEAVKIVVITVA